MGMTSIGEVCSGGLVPGRASRFSGVDHGKTRVERRRVREESCMNSDERIYSTLQLPSTHLACPLEGRCMTCIAPFRSVSIYALHRNLPC